MVGVKIQIGATSCFKIHQHAMAYDSQDKLLYILATNAGSPISTAKSTVLFKIDPEKAGSAMIETAEMIDNGPFAWRHYSAILSTGEGFLPVAGFSQRQSFACYFHIAGVTPLI